MKVKATFKAYDINVNAESDKLSQSLIAQALGSSVVLNGVHEAKVVTATISFSITSAAYDYVQANRLVQEIITNANQTISQFVTDSTNAFSQFVTNSTTEFESFRSEANRVIAKFENDSNDSIQRATSSFNALDTKAKNAYADALKTVEQIKEIKLGMWPAVAVSKEYYATLKADSSLWADFMARYDNYMLFVIQSEDTVPVTPPTPTPSAFHGFGSKFGFVFGGTSSSRQSFFGSKFGFTFGGSSSVSATHGFGSKFGFKFG